MDSQREGRAPERGRVMKDVYRFEEQVVRTRYSVTFRHELPRRHWRHENSVWWVKRHRPSFPFLP